MDARCKSMTDGPTTSFQHKESNHVSKELYCNSKRKSRSMCLIRWRQESAEHRTQCALSVLVSLAYVPLLYTHTTPVFCTRSHTKPFLLPPPQLAYTPTESSDVPYEAAIERLCMSNEQYEGATERLCVSKEPCHISRQLCDVPKSRNMQTCSAHNGALLVKLGNAGLRACAWIAATPHDTPPALRGAALGGLNCLRDRGGTRVLGGTHANTFSDQVFRGRVNQDAEGVVEAAQKEVTKRKTSDFTIRIDKENRVIHVLDHLGVPVSYRTGRPRPRPPLPVVEVQVPDAVMPGQSYTYHIAGSGNILLRAPLHKRGLESGIGALRRHTLLTLAPTPEIAAVSSKYLRGDAVAVSNGSQFALGYAEDLEGGAEGGNGQSLLPAEALYVPPNAKFFATPAAKAMSARQAAAVEREQKQEQPACGGDVPDSIRQHASASVSRRQACGGEVVHSGCSALFNDSVSGYEVPTALDGLWVLPKVNVSEYAAVLEKALIQDSDAGWEVKLHENGTYVATRVRGRRSKWLANRFGPLVCQDALRKRLIFDSPYLLPDVHLQITVASAHNGTLTYLPHEPPTPHELWGIKEEEGGERDIVLRDGMIWEVEEEEEEEKEEEEEEEMEEEGVGLKLRAKYGRWVSGDCVRCCTRPPSRLALLWLPKSLRKGYRAYLNMTEAAARGDLEAERLLSYEAVLNISKLMGKISESLEQEKRFNGGRLRIRYPLHAARVTCSNCNVSWERTPWTLNVLLNETIELTPLEWYSNRKLWAHCQEGSVEGIEEALDTLPAGLLARDPDFCGGVAMHHAASWGHVAAIQCLLERGTPVSVRNEHNWTALHLACRNGQVAAVEVLLQRGAPVDEPGGLIARRRYLSNFRPLHWAAYMGHAEVIRLLLSHGADVHAKEGAGRSALFLATRWAHVPAVLELVAGGASPRQRCVCGIEGSANITSVELAERLSIVYQFPQMVPGSHELEYDTPLQTFPGHEGYQHVRNILRLSSALRNASTSITKS